MRASAMGRSSEAAGARPKAVITPSESTTRATLKPKTHLRSWRRSSRSSPARREEPLARSSYPYDGRDEGSVHHAIDGRRLGELSGEGELQLAHLRLQGSDAPIELALRTEGREVGAQVRLGESPEVPLAAEARPLGEDGQGKDLRVRE